jgi:DNA-binding NarL/FixJ family response regulator
LDQASEAFESIGVSLLAAEAAAHASRVWAAAGQSGRASAARKRSSVLLESCDGARTPWLVTESIQFVLSPREGEVARLAVSGLGNREIAERLGVSKRTVDNQLQRVYEKLEVTGRTQLAAVLGVETPEP